MSVNTATNRFILPPLRLELYQDLLSSRINFQQFSNRLIGYAEQAHAFRQMDRVREAADILRSLPSKQWQDIGHYYLALCIHKMGKGNVDEAQRILESISDRLPRWFRARAVLSLAAVSGRREAYGSELYYYLETLKSSQSIVTSIEALRGVAILKARAGDHASAVRDLESLYSMARHAPPHIYFAYMNSLAVELGAVGRLNEAKKISELVVSSPLAPFYTEWQDTLSEINQKHHKNRSTVAVKLPPRVKRQQKRVRKQPKVKANILPFPVKGYGKPPNTVPVPNRPEIDEAIEIISAMGPGPLVAVALKLLLKERITRDEIQIFCDLFYR